jgi:hypothetical protein
VSADHDLLDVVAELAAGETRGFRASYVAKRTGRPLPAVQRELADMVTRGELEVRYELLCPDDGRLIARYTPADTLPIGETVHHAECEEFDVTPQSLWVTYRPSADLAMALLRRATEAGKARARQGVLRRALERLGIGSIRTHISSRVRTSMRR